MICRNCGEPTERSTDDQDNQIRECPDCGETYDW